ncbi:MAG TPA: hypothetical protein VFI17_11225 [Solirubrobacterales bacterium]|nr:hypothetical protein [Solirubrobacterales bacterium]
MTEANEGRLKGLSKWITELSMRMSGGFLRLDKRIDRVESRLEQRMDARFAVHEEMIGRHA